MVHSLEYMNFIYKHKTLLVVNFALLVIFTAVLFRSLRIIRAAKIAAAEALVVERAVEEEQKIQDKPVEAHTTEEQKIPIFVYHSVRPYVIGESKSQDLYDITPELFEQQLIYLKDNGYHTITTKDLYVDKDTHKVVTNIEKPVMLTFDDGWKNQYVYAYPLLKKYNTKAIIYIYTKPLGAPKFLTWDEIKEMKNSGMVIGSHTLSHPHLKHLSDDVLRHEIFDSKKVLEGKLGITIDDFATPYGYSDDRVAKLVEAAGYRTSRTLYKGSYHKDMYNLKGYLARDAFKDFVFVLQSNN